MAIPADVTALDAATYLSRDRAASVRHELIDRQMVAMASASYSHNLIVANLLTLLTTAVRDGPCRALANDMRVTVVKTGLYAYPDLLLHCEEPVFEDDRADVLLNPVAIFEVLSPSTEAFDRGEKFAHYRRIPSLRDYLLVSQERPRIEHFRRQGELWGMQEASEPDEAVEIAAANARIELGIVYEGIVFGGSN
jgi:Uma2 family endonuclease